eukprot:341674_1
MGLSCFSTPIHKQPSVNIKTTVPVKHYLSVKHELDVYKMKCDELELQNQNLSNKLNKYISPHRKWNYKQICDWIIKLDDGIFQTYKQILLINLQAEDITGKDLCQLDINDLQRLGITLSAHKYLLMAHIKTLTKNDLVPQYNEHYDPHLPHNIHTPASSFHKNGTYSSQMDFDDIKIGTTDPSNTETVGTMTLLAEKWNYSNGVVFVRIIKGINMNVDQECLYIEIELRGDYYQKETAKKICNDKNPIYNERFQFFSDNPKKDILNVRIWSKKKWSLDENVGIVPISVMDILKCDGFIDKQYDINESKYGGKLYLQLKYKELMN